MDKDLPYQEKINMMEAWFPTIIETIKKDLRNHHLKHDPKFAKHYFPRKNISKLTLEEMIEGYQRAIKDPEAGEKVAEFMSDRWLLKHTDLYNFFEVRLTAINPDFTKIESIDDATAEKILEEGKEFNLSDLLIFCIFNSVVFSDKIYDQMKKQALENLEKQKEFALSEEERQSLEAMQKFHEQEKSRLINRYEKKLAGFEKKYDHDMAALKKQIANLQRKVTA